MSPRSTPAPTGDGRARRAAEVRDLLRRIGMGSSHMARRMATSSGVHRTDFDALTVLIGAGRPVAVKELGAALDLSSAAVTALVDRLEGAGHVERRRDDVDRRRVHVDATDLARDTAGAAIGPFVDGLRRALDDFDEDELAAAARVLSAVADLLEDDEHDADADEIDADDGAPT